MTRLRRREMKQGMSRGNGRYWYPRQEAAWNTGNYPCSTSLVHGWLGQWTLVRDEIKEVSRARPSKVVCSDEEFGRYLIMGRRLRIWIHPTIRTTEGFKGRRDPMTRFMVLKNLSVQMRRRNIKLARNWETEITRTWETALEERRVREWEVGSLGDIKRSDGQTQWHSAYTEQATLNLHVLLFCPLWISAIENSGICSIFIRMPSWLSNAGDKFQWGGWWHWCTSLCHPWPSSGPPSGLGKKPQTPEQHSLCAFSQGQGQGRTQPFIRAPFSIHDTEGRQSKKLFIPCHRRTSEASIPSVSRISIWQEILWWAKNIYHLRRETQKCIISVASILPDHFTQTPGRGKHYFTVRTLNAVHTFGWFFSSYVITAYLGVSHLEQPPETGLQSGGFWPITIN